MNCAGQRSCPDVTYPRRPLLGDCDWNRGGCPQARLGGEYQRAVETVPGAHVVDVSEGIRRARRDPGSPIAAEADSIARRQAQSVRAGAPTEIAGIGRGRDEDALATRRRVGGGAT